MVGKGGCMQLKRQKVARNAIKLTWCIENSQMAIKIRPNALGLSPLCHLFQILTLYARRIV